MGARGKAILSAFRGGGVNGKGASGGDGGGGGNGRDTGGGDGGGGANGRDTGGGDGGGGGNSRGAGGGDGGGGVDGDDGSGGDGGVAGDGGDVGVRLLVLRAFSASPKDGRRSGSAKSSAEAAVGTKFAACPKKRGGGSVNGINGSRGCAGNGITSSTGSQSIMVSPIPSVLEVVSIAVKLPSPVSSSEVISMSSKKKQPTFCCGCC